MKGTGREGDADVKGTGWGYAGRLVYHASTPSRPPPIPHRPPPTPHRPHSLTPSSPDSSLLQVFPQSLSSASRRARA